MTKDEIKKVIDSMEVMTRACFLVHFGKALYEVYDVLKGRFAFDVYKLSVGAGGYSVRLKYHTGEEIIKYLQEKEVIAVHVLKFKEWSGLE